MLPFRSKTSEVNIGLEQVENPKTFTKFTDTPSYN